MPYETSAEPLSDASDHKNANTWADFLRFLEVELFNQCLAMQLDEWRVLYFEGLNQGAFFASALDHLPESVLESHWLLVDSCFFLKKSRAPMRELGFKNILFS